VISQTPTLLVARTNGARIPFVKVDEDGTEGEYSQSSFYTDEGTHNLGLFYEHYIDVLTDMCDVATEAIHYYFPKAIWGKAEYSEDGQYQLAVGQRNSLLNISSRARTKELLNIFAAKTKYVIRPSEGGGLTMSFKASNKAMKLTDYARQLEVSLSLYSPAVQAFLDKLKAIGFSADTREAVVRYPLAQMCSPNFFKKEQGVNLRQIAKLKGGFVEFHLLQDRAEPFKVVNPATYEEEVYTEYKNVPKSQQFSYVKYVLQNTKVEAFVSFELTKEEAQYITQSEEPDISDAAEWAHKFITSVDSDYSIFVTPIDKVLAKQREANNGNEPRHRRGTLDLMINPSTLNLVYLPFGKDGNGYDNVANVKKATAAAHIDKNGAYHSTALSEEKEDVVCVDWTANIMTFRTSGRTEYQDIATWGPANPWHIRRAIENGEDTSVDQETLMRDCLAVALKAGLVKPEDFTEKYTPGADNYSFERSKRDLFHPSSSLPAVLKTIVNTLVVYGKDKLKPKAAEEIGEDNADALMARLTKIKFLNVQNPVPIFVFMAEVLAKVHDHIIGRNLSLPDICDLMEKKVSNVLNTLALLRVWEAYGRKPGSFAGLLEEDKVHRSAYGRQPEDQDELPKGYKPKALPNVRDVKGDPLILMPHQTKAAFSLERNPRFVVLDVSAGGGKTLLIILDVLRRLEMGVCTTPFVFCPSHLLANYVQDGNYGTGGKCNIIPINTTTVERFGKEYFEKLVQGAAPPNTIYIIDVDFLKWDKDQIVSYGTVYETVAGNAQWVRSLGGDACWIDESHFVKNESLRSDSVLQAIVDIPYRCLATGTMLATRMEDVVNQMSFLDPGVFGTQTRFMEHHGDENYIHDFETGQAIPQKAWLATMMDRTVCHVKGRRKEWAALLPPKQTKFYWVDISESQRKVYTSIVEETITAIMEDPKLMELLNQQNEDLADKLEAMLKGYLQRIERFLTAPGADDLSGALKGSDLVSPKGTLIGKIAMEHFKQKIPGKILVFTSYVESAKAIVDSLPPEVRKHTILYTAAKKMECREKFEKDPNVWMMVGVEQSMNTGINAQFCSRLIRVESVYSPGILEQGESRINRPNLKVAEFRNVIYTDWVLVDRTIDVTKSGRLMWRSIDAAKFYNPDSNAYQSLPDLNPLRMTLDSIRNNNSFNDSIPEYLAGYLQLQNEVMAQEIEDYKKKHPDLKKDSKIQQSSGLLEGSALLKSVPYVPAGDIFNQADLGLVPLTEYERMPENVGETLKGEYCHTDHGDGIISKFNKNTIKVKIGNDEHSFAKTEVFIITKKVTSTKEIRNALAQSVGLPAVNAIKTKPAEVGPAPDVSDEADEENTKGSKIKKSPVPDTMEDADDVLEVYPELINDYFSLSVGAAEEINKDLKKDLEELGFKYARAVAWVQLKRWPQAEALKAALLDKRRKFEVDPDFIDQLNYVEAALKKGLTHFRQYRKLARNNAGLVMLHRQKAKRLGPNQVRPFIMLVNGEVFVTIDYHNTPAWPRVKAIQIPGAQWKFDDPYYCYMSIKKSDIVAVAKELAKRYKIDDLDWVREEVNSFNTATRAKELEED